METYYIIGRDGKIRTCDLRYPKPSRYQAALRPDTALCYAINEKVSRGEIEIFSSEFGKFYSTSPVVKLFLRFA